MNEKKTPSTSLARMARESLALTKSAAAVPTECRFYCQFCGWDGTLKFSQPEIESLGGDVESYTGPCPGKDDTECGFHGLIPHRLMTDEAMGEGIFGAEARERRERMREDTATVIDTVMERIPAMMAGRQQPAPPPADTQGAVDVAGHELGEGDDPG